MGRLVKCHFCQQLVDRDIAIRYDEKNFHENCYNNYKAKKEIFAYVAKVFKFKSETRPGPKIIAQLNSFITRGYTYQGILNTLIYHFEVCKGSVEKAKEGIGIVPFIYAEAQDYYKKFEYKKQKIADSIEKQLEQNPIELKLKVNSEKKEKQLYNLEELE